MSSSSRRSGSCQSRSCSASNISIRSSRTSSYRNAAQQTSDTGHRSPRRNSSARQRSTSPSRPVSPRPRSPSASPSRAPNRKRFGLNVPNAVPRVPGRFDFEDTYPEDPIYEEMGPNARLWRAFLDECEVFDLDMVTESRDGLDLLLVFAGLFSAVLTTFVTQTSQALSANFPALSSSLLVEMVALQRAQINNTPIDDILPANSSAGPSGFDIWVNALWFTSLTLSLGTALMAVLVKQWLYQYMSMISGTARDRSLIRFYRFEGLQKWHVLTIIGTLPIVLHVALALFLAGLVVFLIPLNTPLACIVGFITLIVYTLYAVSNILPIIYIHCPYRTPFSDILNVMLRAVSTFPSLVVMRVRKLFPVFGDFANTLTAADLAFRTLKDAERIAATDDGGAEEVAWRALLWLYEMTSNPPTKRIIQESLGCLSDDVWKRSQSLQADLEQTLGEISPSTWDETQRLWYRSIPPGQERRVERILRAVRDPLVPRDGLIGSNALWTLDVADTELSFQILTSILAHAPSISVEMNSVPWNLPSLLRHLIDEQYRPARIHFPPRLWTLFMASVSSHIRDYDSGFFASLCHFAVQNIEKAQSESTITSPFAGPVVVSNRTVPLSHLVVNLLVHHMGIPRATDSFDFEPLIKLFTIFDYVESENNSDYTFVLSNTWAVIINLGIIHDNDKAILCRRVENIVLRMTLDVDWWDSLDEGHWRCIYYRNLLGAYRYHGLAHWHTDGSKFLKKLLFDLSLSLTVQITDEFRFLWEMSWALKELLNQNGNAPVYFPLFCAAPFLSTRTLSSVQNCRDLLYPMVSALVEAAAAGGVWREIFLRSVFSEPQRFYTIYWIIALGGDGEHYDDWNEHRRVSLLQLARIDPTHAVWESRVHYMNMDTRDWPYLRLLDEDLDREETISWITQALHISLSILEESLDSLNTSIYVNSTANQEAPPQSIAISQIISSDNLNPTRSSNPHWRLIRQLVSGTRAFLGLSPASHNSPSDPANAMELGLRLGPSGIESGEADPHAEPDAHILRSTMRHSSYSSSANTTRSWHLRSNSDASHSNYQLLAPLHCSESPTPHDAESSTISAPPLETSSPPAGETQDTTGVTPSLHESIHSSIRTTPSSRASHSSDSLHSANSNDSTENALEIRRSYSPSYLIGIASRRLGRAANESLHSRQSANLDVDDTL